MVHTAGHGGRAAGFQKLRESGDAFDDRVTPPRNLQPPAA